MPPPSIVTTPIHRDLREFPKCMPKYWKKTKMNTKEIQVLKAILKQSERLALNLLKEGNSQLRLKILAETPTFKYIYCFAEIKKSRQTIQIKTIVSDWISSFNYDL